MNTNIKNYIDDDVLHSTLIALRKFGYTDYIKIIQNESTPADELKKIITDIPSVVFYDGFSEFALPDSPFLNELKYSSPNTIRLSAARKVEGSYWDDEANRREKHFLPVLRLNCTRTGAVMDFRHPHSKCVKFYKFEVPLKRQRQGKGRAAFTQMWKIITDIDGISGMESPVLCSPKNQPAIRDKRLNWRFQAGLTGQSKLYEYWTRRGGISLDTEDDQRLYFMTFSTACKWLASINDPSELPDVTGLAGDIYTKEQQEVLNDVLCAVNMAA